MDAIASADLSLRVKALEADVAVLQKRLAGLATLAVRMTEQMEALRDADQLRRDG